MSTFEPTETLTWSVIIINIAFGLYVIVNKLANIWVQRQGDRATLQKEEDTFSLRKEVAEDRLSLEAKVFLNETAKEHIATIKKLSNDCQKELEDLREAYSIVLEDSIRLSVQFEESAKKVSERDTRIQSINRRIENYEALTKANELALYELKLEIEKGKLRIEMVEKEALEKGIKNESLKAEIKSLKARIVEIETELDSVRKQRENLTQSNVALKKQLEEMIAANKES